MEVLSVLVPSKDFKSRMKDHALILFTMLLHMHVVCVIIVLGKTEVRV